MTRPPAGEFSSRVAELDAGLEALESLISGGGSQRGLRRTLLREGSPHLSSPFIRDAQDVGELIDRLAPVLQELPPGEPGIAKPHTGLRVAIICDEPLHRSFTGLADLIYLSPESWQEQLAESGPPDLLLVTPVVSGIDGGWSGVERLSSAPRTALTGRIIPHLRARGVPVVFWGTQVPRFYPHWQGIAEQADHILTATAEHLPRYAQDCPRAQSIGLLTMGVNPVHHSPIGTRPAATDLIPFFGTWHEQLFPQRREYAGWLLDGVLESGRPLALMDRRSQDPARTGETAWPPRCTPYLTTTRPRDLVARLHRATDRAIALNSAVGSQTMFSDRILELEASGTMVLSTYNQGVNSEHPHVHIAQSPQDVAAALEVLTHRELRRTQAEGIRKAFLDHHAADRLMTIAAAAGVGTLPRSPRLLAVTEEPSETLRRDLAGQSLGPVELIDWEQLSRRASAGIAEVDMLLPVSPRHRYAPTYAADHLASFAHQRDCVTTKLASPGVPTGTLDGTRPSTTADAVARSDRHSHRHRVGVEDLALSAWWRPAADRLVSAERLGQVARSVQAYAIDGFGHHPASTQITLRDAAPDLDDDVETFAAEVRETAETLGLRLSVVIPVYENGDHLRHKAFASLRRSSLFDQMHILLLDDGSSDQATLQTVDELAREHPQVSAYRFAQGGSGSASRPRDLGVRLAATEQIAFLDPDDEMVEDGLARLVAELDAHPDVDFVLGNFTRWSTRHQRLDHHAEIQETFADHLDAAGTVVLPASPHELWGFRSLRIHAAVVRTAWLQSLEPVQPVGAAGQDNFLAQQMMHRARRIRSVDTPVNAYYSEVSGSMVNSVSPRYFRKYLPLDRARARWLRENDLLETYRRTRFEGYTVNWYLKKLRTVPREQWLEAAETIAEILACYGEHEWTDPVVGQFFSGLETARAGQGGNGADG
ncbi:glycosyltransferase [Nesterenkonia xinjiangensis]|uniref:Glycosyl transferase family 2 n=1 Tax=Nesterenkonia xinjiangensis TaxID=225327 RepID=A0A7Z0GJ83_9MICC|nr:glycosyltransferase [Nesterenkonia xinjiangensis]NYJ76997.1 hypothetical protein [Nesterenkonia xinjiangensis]